MTKFRALPPVIQAITGVLTALTTAAGLLFLFFPGLKPTSAESAPKIKSTLRALDLTQAKLGDFLLLTQKQPGRYTDQQLASVGNMASVQVVLIGLKGQPSPLVWSLYHLVGKQRLLVSDRRFISQKANTIQAPAGDFTDIERIWIPVPPFAGTYVARVEILSNGTSLNFVDTGRFAGRTKLSSPLPPAVPAGSQCTRPGVERWSVKTLADPAASKVDPKVRLTTVHDLVGLHRPAGIVGPRNPPVELTTYRIVARLVDYKLELDSDVHLVVADLKTNETMIIEFPADGCTQGAAPLDREKMRRARASLFHACTPPTTDPRLGAFERLTGTATITGVGFLDSVHGQHGVALNGIELHPVVDFSSANCEAA
jgi:hypothetical protein